MRLPILDGGGDEREEEGARRLTAMPQGVRVIVWTELKPKDDLQAQKMLHDFFALGICSLSIAAISISSEGCPRLSHHRQD